MNIIGPDTLVFGVDDMDACSQFLVDYGLRQVDAGTSGHCFEALDGTSVEIRRKDDPSLPAPMGTASALRQTVYGVSDEANLEKISAELRQDREVKRSPNGVLASVDDAGFALGFQVTRRRAIQLPGERVNAPGAPPQRPVNSIGGRPARRSTTHCS